MLANSTNYGKIYILATRRNKRGKIKKFFIIFNTPQNNELILGIVMTMKEKTTFNKHF